MGVAGGEWRVACGVAAGGVAAGGVAAGGVAAESAATDADGVERVAGGVAVGGRTATSDAAAEGWTASPTAAVVARPPQPVSNSTANSTRTTQRLINQHLRHVAFSGL